MTTLRAVTRVVASMLVVLTVVLGNGIARADAPPRLGSLTFAPATGLDTTRSSVTTVSSGSAKGCPADTTNVSAVAVGPGGWSGGLLVIGTTDQDFSNVQDFRIGLNDTWQGIAKSNSTAVTAGRYDVTLSCIDTTTTVVYGTFTGSLWFSDATHFQNTDPATSSTPTQTSLVTSPVSVVDYGKPVTLTATVTPATSTGTVQFTHDSGQGPVAFGAPVQVSDGSASLVRSNLPLGLYGFGAAFKPAQDGRAQASTSETVTFVVRKQAPPTNRVLPTVRGVARPGHRLSCVRGGWAEATSYTYRWLRDGHGIARATAPAYLLTRSDAGRRVTCQVSATNGGGTTWRKATSVRVAPR